MLPNRMTIWCMGAVTCALWICGLPMLLRPAAAQTSQENPAEKTSKPKRLRKSTPDLDSTQSAPSAAGEKKGNAPAPVKNVSEAEIQSAKAAGQVWVNTDSGLYHKSGRWYGATKHGKFMTEADAIKAGYKAAKNER